MKRVVVVVVESSSGIVYNLLATTAVRSSRNYY